MGKYTKVLSLDLFIKMYFSYLHLRTITFETIPKHSEIANKVALAVGE